MFAGGAEFASLCSVALANLTLVDHRDYARHLERSVCARSRRALLLHVWSSGCASAGLCGGYDLDLIGRKKFLGAVYFAYFEDRNAGIDA